MMSSFRNPDCLEKQEDLTERSLTERSLTNLVRKYFQDDFVYNSNDKSNSFFSKFSMRDFNVRKSVNNMVNFDMNI